MQSRLLNGVFLLVLISGFLFNSRSHAGSNQLTISGIPFQRAGIRFQITASIKADPAYTKQYDAAKASLTAKVRISAHATESQFFGVVVLNAADFSVEDGSPEQVIWRDARCHQRRGLPKETVTGIDGVIITKESKISIHALLRRLGLRLPLDEITQGTRLPRGINKDGALISYRSESKLSHLFVDVKIYAFDCDLADKSSAVPTAEPNH